MACGSVDRYLGMLSETAGSPETALGHYRKAIDFDIKFGAQPWAIHAQLNAATVLASIGRTNESLQMSRLAITGAKELGMQNVAFKSERLLRRIAKQRLSE